MGESPFQKKDSFISTAAKSNAPSYVATASPKLKPDANWFETSRETLLLFGKAKSGKTWAACSVLYDALEKGTTVVILNTDGGVARTLRQFLNEQGKKADEYVQSKSSAGQLIYYFCNSVNEGVEALKQIQQLEKEGKKILVMIDLISDFWQYSQDTFVDDATNGKPEDYILMAQKDTAKFGLLEKGKWQYCKNLDNMVTWRVIQKCNADIVAIAACKDMEVEEKITRKKSDDLEFEHIGFRPSGQKELAHRFNSVFYIGGHGKKFFKVAGDRGYQKSTDTISFEKNFWDAVKKQRGN